MNALESIFRKVGFKPSVEILQAVTDASCKVGYYREGALQEIILAISKAASNKRNGIDAKEAHMIIKRHAPVVFKRTR